MKRTFEIKAALVCVVMITLLLLSGCGGISFRVSDVKFGFSAEVESGSSPSLPVSEVRSSAPLFSDPLPNSFTVTRKVLLSEITSDNRISKITSVTASNALLVVTASGASHSVSDLTVTTEGLSGSLAVSSYTLGETFPAPSNMASYTASLVMKLIKDKEVTVTVSGYTDAPVGTNISISYESDLLFSAKLF